MNKNAARGNAFMLVLVLFNIVLIYGIGFLYYSLGERFAAALTAPWFSVVNQMLCFLLPLGVWMAVTRCRPRDILPNARLGRVNIILIVALSFCLQPAMMMLSAITSIIFPNAASAFLSDMQSYPLPVMLFIVAVTPAFCEEVVFRGYILTQFEKLNNKTAAVVSGLFFGIIHFSAQQFLYAFAMGIVFAYLVRYTHSIRASMLAHFCVNAIQLLMSTVLNAAYSSNAAETAETPEIWRTALYMAAIAMIFMPAVTILFRSFITHNRQQNMKRAFSTLSEI